MTEKFDIIFNSEKENNKGFQIASGYISTTKILFEKENIFALIEAKGVVKLFDLSENLLFEAKLPAVEGGKEVYEEVVCEAKENLIILKFPTYEWVDNYPHCDGEHDRWSTRKIGEETVKFDCKNYLVL